MSTLRRAALVTGASRNIGRAIALALAETGHDVVVHARADATGAEAVAEAVRAHGGRCTVALAELGEREAVDRLANSALDAFGRIDVLVANAAIRPSRPFMELDENDWSRVLDVNLRAPIRLASACVPGMVERGFGRIVYFTGMNAMQGYVGRAPVSVAKHALVGLTRSMAREFGPHGVTVNAVSPGPIDTEHPDDPAMAEHIRSQVGKIPLGRLGRPEEIAALVAFLGSDAGGFVSGQMVAANGAAYT